MPFSVCVCSSLIYLTIYTHNRTVHYTTTPTGSTLQPRLLADRFYLQNVAKKERRTVVVVVVIGTGTCQSSEHDTPDLVEAVCSDRPGHARVYVVTDYQV